MGKRDVIAERTELLREFPSQQVGEPTAELLEKAEQAAEGTVFFYQSTPVKVGLKDIDWSGSHVQHQEWRAQLNRFGYLMPLASAWRKTGEERFAAAARSTIEDWIDSGGSYETTDELKPGDNTLSMSIRLGSSVHSGWGGTLHAFLTSDSFDDTFLEKVLSSIGTQAAFLSRHLSARGNWRISELDALVFTALRFPFLPNTGRLIEVGIAGLRCALGTQFLPDGVHVERTPGYHRWMANVAANYRHLAEVFPEADARVKADTVVKAFDYVAQSDLFGVNDATAPLADPEELEGVAVRAKALALAGLARGAAQPPPTEQVFGEAGQVFLRSSWEPGADYVAFDASTWGGAHTHLSRLSFVFRSGGRVLVADPGILSYEMTDPFGPYGKSTPAHSTLNVNGWNQSQADATLLRTEFTPEAALVHAQYAGGYWEGEFGWRWREGHKRGVFGIHERVLFQVRGEYVLALDRMATDPGVEVRNCWQLGATDAWRADEKALAWHSQNSDVNLLVKLVTAPEGAGMECFEGRTDPLRGWVGDSLDRARPVPAPLVEFRYPGGTYLGDASAVLLVPFTGSKPPDYVVGESQSLAQGRLHVVELSLPGGGTDLVAWSRQLEVPVETGRLVTDAPFVWLRTDASGNVTKRFLLDGTYLEIDGERAI